MRPHRRLERHSRTKVKALTRLREENPNRWINNVQVQVQVEVEVEVPPLNPGR